MLFFLLAALAIIIAAGFTAVFFSLRKKIVMPPPDFGQPLLLLQNQLNELTRTLDSRLHESARLIQNQFGASAKIIAAVTEKLVKLDETNKQVVGFADQLRNLQDILQNPKQRGILGEYYLETVLKNVLPPGSYQMQYPFKNGEVVDAVIFLREKILPIDSKFSLENYNRLVAERDPLERERLEKLFRQDLKNRIDETSKYVQPEQGTMEFAFMFIPSEAIYYDLLVNQIGATKSSARDLVQYAVGEKKVFIVSPTTFFAYLQAILQGLKALQVEESAKEIRKRVEELGRHLAGYEVYMQKLGMHLGTSVNMYNQAYRELGKIDKDVLRITGQPVGVEPALLDKPNQEID